MKSQKLYSYVRKAVDDFGMIEDGDKIAIGISGGKDSLTLLYALSGLKIFYPNKFQLVAITVDLGFGIQDLDKITSGTSHRQAYIPCSLSGWQESRQSLCFGRPFISWRMLSCLTTAMV